MNCIPSGYLVVEKLTLPLFYVFFFCFVLLVFFCNTILLNRVCLVHLFQFYSLSSPSISILLSSPCPLTIFFYMVFRYYILLKNCVISNRIMQFRINIMDYFISEDNEVLLSVITLSCSSRLNKINRIYIIDMLTAHEK